MVAIIVQVDTERYAIDLFGLSLKEVHEQFPELYQHGLTNVKPDQRSNQQDEPSRKLVDFWGSKARIAQCSRKT